MPDQEGIGLIYTLNGIIYFDFLGLRKKIVNNLAIVRGL